MNHVWILNHYAQTPRGSGGTRHYNLAKNLARYGWSASIIAGSVEHQTQHQRLNEEENKHLEIIDGIPFLWLRTPAYEGNGWQRLFNMLAYTVRALLPRNTKELQKPDAIIGSSVHPFAALAGSILAWQKRVPFIFEVRDLWPQTLIDMGRLRPNGLLTRVLKMMELWLYRRAKNIIVLLPNAAAYIVPLGIPKERITWIPNGADLTSFPCPKPPSLSPTVFTLMYFGAHGQANGLDNLINAMALLKETPVKLRMIGDGPLKPALMDQAEKLGLNNIVFEPPVPKSEIPSLANETDAFIVCLRDLPLYRYGISLNKMYDYLAGARPIVYSGAAANNPVDEAKAGITVAPDDPKALAEAIKRLISLSPEERAEMGRNGRRHVEENYSFESLAGRLASVLDKCL